MPGLVQRVFARGRRGPQGGRSRVNEWIDSNLANFRPAMRLDGFISDSKDIWRVRLCFSDGNLDRRDHAT